MVNKMASRSKPIKELSGFGFTDVAGLDFSTHTYIDGMAAGSFVAMTGESVTFLPEELEDYVRNTRKVIESTRTERGEVVGLPIDENSHDHKGGAGWIVDLKLDKRRNIIRFLVNWTDRGAELVKTNVRRFFSPSVDAEMKHIRGGSLTNWPATRLPTGQILLRPVELSETMKEIDMDNVVLQAINDLKDSITEAISGSRSKTSPADLQQQAPEDLTQVDRSETISPALKELLGSQEGIDELGKRAMEIAQDAIKAEKRKLHTVEFASRIVGGTTDKPFGLRVRPNDLVALLLSLPENKALAVEKILSDTLDAAVDFSERGVDSLGYMRRPKLPAEFRGALAQWIAASKPIKEFFAVNPEIGDVDSFDLSEFQVKE